MNKLKILSLSFGCFISAISYTNASTSSTRKWTSEEDERLVSLMNTHGEVWTTVAAQIPDRNQRQCRERWNNYLGSSDLAWTPEEDDLLVQKVKELGPNWPRIASFFVNRSPMICKNRWTANERRSREQQSQSSSLW
ncbi:MAG: hypothetical protein LBJ13_00215, partial [Puniceicoccales bacterium]|nr:hypothetical protein [Puniceicoccales bacterium]